MIAEIPWMVTLQFEGKRPFFWGWLASSEKRLRHDIALFMPDSVKIVGIERQTQLEKPEMPVQLVEPGANA